MTLAQRLDEAAANATAIPQLTLTEDLDVDKAYAIQAELVERRLGRGESLVGLKMGLTSKAKMAQVGVDTLIWGRLTDAMRVDDGGTIDVSRFIHPRIEPEVAFLLQGGEIAAVAPALEIIDSRYADFQFTLPDVVADNTSGAAFVIGAFQPVPAGLDNLGVLLEVDGRVKQTGSTAAILGDPRRALSEGKVLAGRYGVPIKDGWIFLAGAATAAVPLTAGSHVRAVVEGLGSVSVRAR
jgi:2-oxo-3-hexenedioate decarboxylase